MQRLREFALAQALAQGIDGSVAYPVTKTGGVFLVAFVGAVCFREARRSHRACRHPVWADCRFAPEFRISSWRRSMKHLYRQLTWPEARDRAAAGTVVVIPVAAIEQHGDHLPIDVDNLLVEHITEEAALRSKGDIIIAHDSLRVQRTQHGFSRHDFNQDTVFTGFCHDVAHSFARQGYDRLVFVNGHGSNQLPCNLAARRINNSIPTLCDSVAHWATRQGCPDEIAGIRFPRWHDTRVQLRNSHGFAFERQLRGHGKRPARGRLPPPSNTRL